MLHLVVSSLGSFTQMDQCPGALYPGWQVRRSPAPGCRSVDPKVRDVRSVRQPPQLMQNGRPRR
jgi:hypothetical protein